ncbi:hypothetical protein [Phenylobacterium sp.]|uniref:hypothetical protein n=1 Tax=Phenylobacterium sp. TaxID=1871053 RepID=UPI0035B37C7D
MRRMMISAVGLASLALVVGEASAATPASGKCLALELAVERDAAAFSKTKTAQVVDFPTPGDLYESYVERVKSEPLAELEREVRDGTATLEKIQAEDGPSEELSLNLSLARLSGCYVKVLGAGR